MFFFSHKKWQGEIKMALINIITSFLETNFLTFYILHCLDFYFIQLNFEGVKIFAKIKSC